MEDGGFKLFDGSQIAAALLTPSNRAQRLIQELDPERVERITLAKFRSAAESELAALHSGVPLPVKLLDRALEMLQLPHDDSYHMDSAAFESTLLNLLRIMENALQEEPLVVSILDGVVIKSWLEEDEFAMMAEDLFADLDVNESGKFSRNKLRAGLLRMGIEMGIPIPSVKPEADALFSSICEKYDLERNEDLDQPEFAKLLQTILQEIADALASQPIIAFLNIKVNNGYRLRKILADDDRLSEVAHRIFEELDVNKDGKLDKSAACQYFETRGEQWGLPLKEEGDIVEELFEDIFSIAHMDQSGMLEKEEFKSLVKEVFEGFAEQLEIIPIFQSADNDFN